MKTINEYLFSKKSDLNKLSKNNRFHITEKDMIGDLKGFPVGIVVRMLEETEKQGNKPDVKVFQKHKTSNKSIGGFDWDDTEDDGDFWGNILILNDFDEFFKKYPEYKKYDL